MMMHLLNGIVIFPLIYAYALFGKLPGSPAARGIQWGVGLWLAAGLVLMPMMGAGIFGTRMGGLMSAMASLMGHIVYGGLLGWIAGEGHSQAQTRTAVA